MQASFRVANSTTSDWRQEQRSRCHRKSELLVLSQSKAGKATSRNRYIIFAVSIWSHMVGFYVVVIAVGGSATRRIKANFIRLHFPTSPPSAPSTLRAPCTSPQGHHSCGYELVAPNPSASIARWFKSCVMNNRLGSLSGLVEHEVAS
nr:hypothetical protein CFP56_68800 [Quercus suber]